MRCLLPLLVLCLLLPGCNKEEQSKAQNTAENVTTSVSDAAQRVANTTKVKSALQSSNKLDASRIDVDTNEDRTVVLWGYVNSAEEKATALRITNDIVGNDYKVEDKLEVKPKK